MENKCTIGKKIKEKRLELNIRMEEVSRQVGITRSTLWAIENGKGNYTIDALLKLLSFFGLNFEIETNNEVSKRNRASRVNSVLDKKINRFIVMCVEQYASFVQESSQNVFKALDEKGIIKELTDDYEDMHGMSTYSLNEYIGKRLLGGAK